MTHGELRKREPANAGTDYLAQNFVTNIQYDRQLSPSERIPVRRDQL